MSVSSQIREIYNALRARQRKDLKTTVVRGAAGTFAFKIINRGLVFLISLILARLLGATGYGAYAYVMTLVGLLSVPSILGMDRLLIREVAAYQTKKEWGLIRGLIKWSNSIVFLLSLSIVILAFFVTMLFFNRSDSYIIHAFMIGLLLIPISALTRLRQTALQGLQRVIAGQIPESLVQPLVFIMLIVSVFIFMRHQHDVNTVMILNIISTGIAFFISIRLLSKNLPSEVKSAEPLYRKSEWMRSVFPLLFIAHIQTVNSRVDVVILGAMKGPSSVGIYSVASRGAELISFILIAVNTAIAPVISSLYASNDIARLQRMINRIVRLLFLSSLPVALVFIVFGKWLLLLFGRDFTEGATALAIMSVGQFVNVSIGPVGLLLIMTGNEVYVLRGLAVSTVLNVILNIILIPSFGVEGCAIANAASMITWNILLAWLVYKKVGIRVW